MTDSNGMTSVQRIAAARAARPATDHNGRPIGPTLVYRYDANGLLIAVEPAATQ